MVWRAIAATTILECTLLRESRHRVRRFTGIQKRASDGGFLLLRADAAIPTSRFSGDHASQLGLAGPTDGKSTQIRVSGRVQTPRYSIYIEYPTCRLGRGRRPSSRGPPARPTWKRSNYPVESLGRRQDKLLSESSKRGKRIRLFGHIAISEVRAVAIECRHKAQCQYASEQSNRYSTRALVLVFRRARFRGVKVALPDKGKGA